MTGFNFDSLTLGEVAFIEDLGGLSISALAQDDAPKGKALAAIVTVAKRRTGHPEFTFNEALTVPLSEANALLGFDVEDTPEEAEESGKGSSSQKSGRASKRSSSSTSA